MKYRLYTEDVKNGLTDFNENHYHILASKIVAGTTIAVVYDEYQYIVAYRLNYDILDSIHWGQGHYYDDLLDAVRKYESYKEKDRTGTAMPERSGNMKNTQYSHYSTMRQYCQ